MSVSYTCTHCGVTLKTPKRVQVGKTVPCPKCGQTFVPEPEEEASSGGAGVLKLADEPKKPAPPLAPVKRPIDDDDDEDAASVKRGYGVVGETEEEKQRIEDNKPKFTDVQDKFKKSARGPAMSLLVMPSNLLTLEGLITGVAGLGMFMYGVWPLIFNDAPPGEEETEEAIIYMMLGMVTFLWGGMVCFCASQMQELGSYPWALVGSIMGIVPLLIGIYGIVMLQNPKVKAGFEEVEGALDEDEEEDGGDDDDENDDDDDDEEPKRGKKGGREKARNR
ncbi:unnamed protein product [Gemmata massiliana]|uniref:Zinc finger/thioredoxin putative domain-containing protein n=1 Tax=Gemmata massiliana TaxID=1210884 RepID=A0A6P2DLK6_9BACT|nr:hypothetical protein [Gemmata massiliana]VTS02622.1 unnamed protein product [Gemmata massiliana]